MRVREYLKTDGKMMKLFIEESQLIKVGGMRELEHFHFAVLMIIIKVVTIS